MRQQVRDRPKKQLNKFSNPNDTEFIARFSTNNVLIHKKKPENSNTDITVYLPGYLRVKLKNFVDIDLTNLTSEINMDLIFNIYYGDLFLSDQVFEDVQNREKVLQAFQKEIKLNFSRGEAVILSQFINEEQNLQIKVKRQLDNQIRFTLRKALHLHLEGEIWFSPFQLVHQILQVTVQPLTLQIQDAKYTFKLNLMNHHDSELKLSFVQSGLNFGRYGLAKSQTKSTYTNVRIQKAKEFEMSLHQREAFLQKKHKQEGKKIITNSGVNRSNEKDIKYFQYALFDIPIYKYPMDTIVTVFVPLWLLGIVNLGIFFQDGNLSDRLASIITLVVAFITYIPTIEETIPPTSNIVLGEWMVIIKCCEVICTFVHSLKVRFEGEKFRLKWTETPEYWIAFMLLIFSFVFVLVLTIIHYCYLRKLYTSKKSAKNSSKKSSNQINQKQSKLMPLKKKNNKFMRKQWQNNDCDNYFNRFFKCERQERKQQLQKIKVQKQGFIEQSNKKYCQYFIVVPRKNALKLNQVIALKQQQPTKIQAQSQFQISQIRIKKHDSNILSETRSLSYKSTNLPLVHFVYRDNRLANSSLQQVEWKQVNEVNAYLPGYLRLKLKNIISLDLENLGGELNATMIFTIYYGALFDYLVRKLKINRKDQDYIMEKMQNQFIILFAKDDAIQLTEGKIKIKDTQFKEKDQIKAKRNIDTTIKKDSKNREIQFTVRKVFNVRMQSHIFLTPFEQIKTIIDVNVNSLKVPIKRDNIKINLNLHINLMNNPNRIDKISISQIKKFGNYGLILSELDAKYFNDKVRAEEGFKTQNTQQDDHENLNRESWRTNRNTKKKQSRKIQDLKRVFSQDKYIALRPACRRIYQKELLKLQLVDYDKQTDTEKMFLQENPKIKARKFDQSQKSEHFKYACFKIPLYRFPFDFIVIVFLPLWVLAALNLGIFFQDFVLAERLMSIATMLVAFVALIPTIRAQIPPNPSITLIELIVASLMFTSFLAVGHSLSVHQKPDFQLREWWLDAWFMISLIISILSFLIIMGLLIYHYAIRQPDYKSFKSLNQNKFDRNNWFNTQCDQEMCKKFLLKQVKLNQRQDHWLKILTLNIDIGLRTVQKQLMSNEIFEEQKSWWSPISWLGMNRNNIKDPPNKSGSQRVFFEQNQTM